MRGSSVGGGALGLALVLLAGCGGSSTQPSPATPSSGTGAPVLKFTLQADDGRSRDAITALSDIVADASGSTATSALTYAIDFGDGATATTSSAHHTYAAPGTFTVTATVTDAAGRKASASKDMTVKNATGAWYQTGFVAHAGSVEVRRLELTAQDGVTVRGTYQVNNGPVRSVTGTLTKPRHLRLAADGGATLEGDVPSRLGDDLDAIALLAHGDSADGLTLQFQPVTGQPSGANPKASFSLSFGDGTLVAPVASVTPVHIDATASAGTDLTYFLEYGDGFVATTAQAAHAVDAPGLPAITARVTVVDRFGRSDAATRSYNTFDLGINGEPFEKAFWTNNFGPHTEYLWISVFQRSGNQFSGGIADDTPGLPNLGVPFTAVVTGDGTHVHISAPGLNAEWDGTIQLAVKSVGDVTCTLVQHGGRHDGVTYVVRYYTDV
jgi:hypothetical protein